MNQRKDSNIERIGVYEVALLFTKVIKWIFREQPIVDVGIDALIEQVIDGEPKGKFLATQIKSGEGNFYSTKTSLTYYVSNVHYNYWVNFNLPIVIIAHLPNLNKTVWQLINKENLIRTGKKWKIIIPKDKELNTNSILEFEQIIGYSNQDEFITQFQLGDISDLQIKKIKLEVKSTNLSRISIVQMNKYIAELGNFSNKQTKEIDYFIEIGLSKSDKRVERSVKKYAEFLNIITRKLNIEIDNFVFHYSKGIRAQEKLTLINLFINKDYKTTKEIYDSVIKLEPSFSSAIEGIKSLRNSISGLPNGYSHLKKAKHKFVDTANLLKDELKEANKMNLSFTTNLKKHLD